MWSTTLPSDERIAGFLAEQRELAYSYPEVGQSLDGSPSGYNIDHNRALLGHGELR